MCRRTLVCRMLYRNSNIIYAIARIYLPQIELSRKWRPRIIIIILYRKFNVSVKFKCEWNSAPNIELDTTLPSYGLDAQMKMLHIQFSSCICLCSCRGSVFFWSHSLLLFNNNKWKDETTIKWVKETLCLNKVYIYQYNCLLYSVCRVEAKWVQHAPHT